MLTFRFIFIIFFFLSFLSSLSLSVSVSLSLSLSLFPFNFLSFFLSSFLSSFLSFFDYEKPGVVCSWIIFPINYCLIHLIIVLQNFISNLFLTNFFPSKFFLKNIKKLVFESNVSNNNQKKSKNEVTCNTRFLLRWKRTISINKWN